MHDVTIRGRRRLVLAGLTLLLFAAAPTPTQAQDPAKAPVRADASKFSPAQIEQIAAPIALYPDPLLAQIFMASTYPLEIVEADRWRKKNPTLSGSGLESGLKEQEWDPSVKSLCTFPTVLARMSENLDWTQDVGDAFLGQREELMAAVQALRKKAKDAGQLATNSQQTVIYEGDTIVVRPVNPDVIYVPSYPPTWFYGPAYTYPYYYPVMYPPCPPAGNPWVGFGAGIIVGGAIWGDCNWGNGDVDVDIEHHNNYTKNVNRGDRVEHYNKDGRGKGKWNHDSSHRKGVNYKNAATRDKVGGASKGTPRVSTNDARGRGNAGGGSAPKPAARPAAKPAAKPTPAPSAPNRAAPKASGGALNGSRNTNMDRAASSRGAASRGSAGARGGGSRPSGGARGGGGSRGGGGGGRRR